MGNRSVITIGNFDGVHVGHQAIVAEARRTADRHGVPLIAITFDPHPARVLRPGAEPPRLSTLARRRELLHEAGADEVVVLEPTLDLLGQSPGQFIEQLVQRHGPMVMVEGPDFRFGKDRAGDLVLLAELGRAFDFRLIIQPAVEARLTDWRAAPVSSSLIRYLVGHGRVLDAAACLGRSFELVAGVVVGEKRGRTIGVPTANLDPAGYAGHILPADGVYAGSAMLADGSVRPAAISVGVKPAFPNRPLTVEAHLLDFAGDLYGQPITLRFSRWLRDQYPFPGLDALKAQIARDIALTRHWHEAGLLALPRLAHHANQRVAG